MVESVSQHKPEWKYLSQDWQTEIKRWARKKKKTVYTGVNWELSFLCFPSLREGKKGGLSFFLLLPSSNYLKSTELGKIQQRLQSE